MGWCSGSDVWDPMANTIVEKVKQKQMNQEIAFDILQKLAKTLRFMDWDCDEPYGVEWVDKALGYSRCDKHDIMFREKYGCWDCEQEEEE